jgi:EAL domain-containing protein (putative c-di-GMP-specific phosphodiesterase class I)
MSGKFHDVLNAIPLHRVVLEITEHTDVEDYPCLLNVLQPLRQAGLKLAVDDAGAGYSSLRHILNLQPDFINWTWTLSGTSISTRPAARWRRP